VNPSKEWFHRYGSLDGPGVERTRVCENHGPLDDLPQLAHIIRPRRATQNRFGLGRQCAPVGAGEAARQRPNILRAIDQGRQLDRDGGQAPEEIATQRPALETRPHVLLYSRHDSHIHRDWLILIQRPYLPGLHGAQELRLTLDRQAEELIEKERAPVGDAEVAGSGLHRAGERASAMSEEEAVGHLAGQRRAIHGNQTPGPRAPPVEVLRQ
jgi:hypothetical protein